MQSTIPHRKSLKRKIIDFRFYPSLEIMDSQYFNDIKKVRCIALNENNLVCMISDNGVFNWIVPGGTIEKGENAISTLKRELLEEADIEICRYELLGFLKLRFINHLPAKKVREYTEMWFLADIKKVLEQTEDPAKGQILHRDFFEPEEFAFRFQRWGKISKYFLEKIYQRSKQRR